MIVNIFKQSVDGNAVCQYYNADKDQKGTVECRMLSGHKLALSVLGGQRNGPMVL